MISTVFFLLVIYQIKHFLADYPLQGQYMLGKFKPGWDFLGPLTAHASVHGLMTLAIAYSLAGVSLPIALGVAALDFAIHFTMDRIKASPRMMGRWKPLTGPQYVQAQKESKAGPGEIEGLTFDGVVEAGKRLRGNTYFWWALGFDQAIHHLTHYGLIWIILSNLR